MLRRSIAARLLTAVAMLVGIVWTAESATAQAPTPGQRPAPAGNQEKEPKVGDVAPDWKLEGTDGKTYQLSDFKGKQFVVVAWYPKALTGG